MDNKSKFPLLALVYSFSLLFLLFGFLPCCNLFNSSTKSTVRTQPEDEAALEAATQRPAPVMLPYVYILTKTLIWFCVSFLSLIMPGLVPKTPSKVRAYTVIVTTRFPRLYKSCYYPVYFKKCLHTWTQHLAKSDTSVQTENQI